VEKSGSIRRRTLLRYDPLLQEAVFDKSASHTIYAPRALLIRLFLVLSGCEEDPPAIGAGLPASFAEARSVFDLRVQERFISHAGCVGHFVVGR